MIRKVDDMAKRMSQREIRNRIAELKIIQRSGMMRAVAAFVGMAAIIAIYLAFQFQGAEWANSMFGSMALFILAIIAAGIAGLGTRRWKLARKEMEELKKRLK